MGGGDLNLKKSWHPQTIRNVERVWKAEQKATAEAKKIEQLQRELMEERAREDMQRHAIEQGISKKKSDRLEWMYATPGQVDREQYLLGKAIDKSVDPLANSDQQENNVPGASFASNANVNTPADLAAKVRDDPLFLIKKKEEEKKKELLNNPVKMKHLRQMLQENLGKSKKKKDKKRKKEKKSKKRRAKDSGDSSDSGDDATHQPHANPKHQRPHKHKQSRSMDRKHKRNTSESPERTTRHRQKRHSKSPQRNRRRSRSRSIDRNHRRMPSESPERTTRQNHRHTPSPPRKLKSVSRNDSVRSNHRKQRRSPSPQLYGHRYRRHSSSPELKKSRKAHSPLRRDWQFKRSRSPSPKRNSRHRGSAVTKKMSAEELEKRREEMLSNAQWRNDQRTANVKKYNDTEKEEAETEMKNAGKSAQFLSTMKVQSFSSDSTASVSDRIKRNINSLQRTNAALDNFLVKK